MEIKTSLTRPVPGGPEEKKKRGGGGGDRYTEKGGKGKKILIILTSKGRKTRAFSLVLYLKNINNKIIHTRKKKLFFWLKFKFASPFLPRWVERKFPPCAVWDRTRQEEKRLFDSIMKQKSPRTTKQMIGSIFAGLKAPPPKKKN